jgi:hypothetical protein
MEHPISAPAHGREGHGLALPQLLRDDRRQAFLDVREEALEITRQGRLQQLPKDLAEHGVLICEVNDRGRQEACVMVIARRRGNGKRMDSTERRQHYGLADS